LEHKVKQYQKAQSGKQPRNEPQQQKSVKS